MSHMTTIAIQVKDLAALKAAVIELGALWMEGQRTHKWYGQSVGDYPLPKGVTVDMLGKCDHAIKVPGVNYEIGVVKLADGTVEKWLEKAGVDSFDEMTGETIGKCIDFVKGKLAA